MLVAKSIQKMLHFRLRLEVTFKTQPLFVWLICILPGFPLFWEQRKHFFRIYFKTFKKTIIIYLKE